MNSLLVGSMLTTLINNADAVKIACLAQLVNTIAPIMTEPGGRSWVQTTYYPFLYTSQRGRGAALKADLESPVYSCGAGRDIPCIDCAAVLSEGGNEIALFLVNKDLKQDISCELRAEGLLFERALEWVSLNGCPLDAVNTADQAPVRPQLRGDISLAGGAVSFSLPRASWNMVRLQVRMG